jgi:hypothetical protein
MKELRDVIVTMTAALAVLTLCSAQTRLKKPAPTSKEYSQYEYASNVDYSQASDYHEIMDTRIPCYSCLYFKFGLDDFQGLENCNEPFVPIGIPEQLCSESCAKVYTRTGVAPHSHITVTRACLPKCKEQISNTSYTQCCKRRLCNGDRSASRVNRGTLCLLLSSILTAFFLTTFNLG